MKLRVSVLPAHPPCLKQATRGYKRGGGSSEEGE